MEFKDFFCFDKFVTPFFIKSFYYIGLAFWILAGLALIFSVSILQGIGFLVIMPLCWRISIEVALVIFKVFDEVKELKQLIVQGKEE